MGAKISIIIPYYRTPKDLFDRCMQSVLANKNKCIEIIVVDDGSPEECRSTIEAYSGEDNVRIIYAPHKGVSSARNRGITEAKGKWITFVDSDDYVDSNTLNNLISNSDRFTGDIELFNGGLEKNGTIISNTTFLVEGYNYGKNIADKLKIMESALTAGILPEGYVQKFSYGSPYCKLFRIDFLRNNKLLFNEEVKFAEDTLFLLNAYEKANNIFYHECFLYYYVDNSQSVTRKYRPGLSKDMDVFFSKVAEFLSANSLVSELRNAFYIRARLEAGRAFSLEFFNPNNHRKGQRQEYLCFINKEPYRTALNEKRIINVGLRKRLFDFMVKNGLGKLYKVIKSL